MRRQSLNVVLALVQLTEIYAKLLQDYERQMAD